MKLNVQSGQSVVEVVLAAAIFVIFATGLVSAFLQSYNANRLGLEFSVANQFAAEGIEAVRSIKNQAYANLTVSAGTGVVAGSTWQFGGANNTLVHNSGDNYTRIIKIDSVNRDGSGNIVPTGTPDPDTRKVTSTVTWNFNTARSESVDLVSYLTNWRKSISSGLLVYGDSVNAPTIPKYRFYTNSSNSFGAESSAPTGTAVGRTFKIKTSPIKQEAIAGYVDSSNKLQIMCFDGTAWSNEWSVASVGGSTTARFGIGYETNSGDVMVAYSRNVAATNAVDYKVKLGSTGCGSANWSATASLPTSTSVTTGTVQWIKFASDPRSSSNLMTMIWADSNQDLGAIVWNGSAWSTTNMKVLETTLEVASAAQDVDSFEVAYEFTSGNVMTVWGSGGSATVNGAWYNRCVGGTSSCTWTAARTAITSMLNDATNLSLAANPNTDEMVFASIGNGGSDLQAAYWSGSAWAGQNDIDASAATPVAGTKLVSVGWLVSGATTRSVVLYDNSGTATTVQGFVGVGGVFTRQGGADPAAWFTPAPAFGSPQRWYDIQMDPINKNQLMFVVSDGANDLFAKRLVMDATPVFTWSNSDVSPALDQNLGQAITAPFGFAYWRSP